jgi:ribosomal protein S20
MDYTSLKMIAMVAAIIGFHFYVRWLVKDVIKENRYFVTDILEEIESRRNSPIAQAFHDYSAQLDREKEQEEVRRAARKDQRVTKQDIETAKERMDKAQQALDAYVNRPILHSQDGLKHLRLMEELRLSTDEHLWLVSKLRPE